MSREELARAVNARTWGPGRFRRALRLARAVAARYLRRSAATPTRFYKNGAGG